MINKISSIAASLLLAALLWTCPASAQFTDQATGLYATTGSANAYAATVPNVNSLADALAVKFTLLPNFTNTGATTLNISGTGAKNVLKPGPAGLVALTGNELITGSPPQPAVVQYDGTEYVIISSINSTASTLFVSPQGYVTPCSTASPPAGCTAGQIVPTGDVTVGVGQTVTGVVYTPNAGLGNQIPIWNGTQFVVFTPPELTLTLGSTNLANTIYDLCVFSNSGTPTLVSSVAWTTSTTGAGARGSGAGTAQIQTQNGVWVNAVSISAKNGASTFSVPAQQCTMVATMLVSGSNGVLTFTRTYGQSRVWPIANFYNKQSLLLKVGDSTATWSYANAFRNSDGSAANSAIILNPLSQEALQVTFYQSATFANTAGTAATRITYNGTACGFSPQFQNSAGTNNVISFVATCNNIPSIGINTIQMQEQGTGSTGTWNGTETGNLMTAKWRG